MHSAPEDDLLEQFRPTVAEIDLGAFRRNVATVRAVLPSSSRLIAVLKADAYGHGAAALGQVCADAGVEMIAVALLEEALELRSVGVTLPVLILGPLSESQLPRAAREKFVLGIPGPEELRHVVEYARSAEVDIHIHLKLDSGMGRMGIREEELGEVITLVSGAAHLKLDGIYTHFANASDPGDAFTARQEATFERMVESLASRGVGAPLHHRANSAATMRRLVAGGDYARVGLTLYGGEPLDVGESRLEPLLTWRTRIARIKSIGRGDVVGYGTTFSAGRESRIATLPVGYADGYSRQLSNRGIVLVRGRRAPVVGRVSMDLVTIDVTDIAGVEYGDEVVLLGRQGEDEISAEEIARLTGTISYEVFCAVGARVPRVYLNGSSRSLISRFGGSGLNHGGRS